MLNNGQDLLNACKKGDVRAQRIFYDQYKGKMFVLCLRYSNSREDAEDILQEGFIKVFRDLGQYRGQGSLEGWIRKVVLRVALDHLRKQKRMIQTTDISEQEFRLPSDDFEFEEGDENAKGLIKLMQKMPVGFRTVLNLYVLEGYTHPQIAEVLGISVETSKSQLNRAKKYLKNLLENSLTK